MNDGSRTPRRAKSATAKRSAATDRSGKSAAPSKKRAEASLDEALDDTFPASDPVSPKHIT